MRCCAVLVFGGLLAFVHCLPMTLLEKANPMGLHLNKVGDIWANCSKAGDPMKIDKVVITPDPPKKGQSITVQFHFTLAEEVTGGSIALNISFDSVPFYNAKLDLCMIIPDVSQLSCPLKEGPHTVTVVQTIPEFLPSGQYSGKAEVTDQNGAELACININLAL